MIEASMRIPPNYAMFIPSAIRKAVRLPVIGVGRVKDPIQAERLLSEGHADLVGVVRAQIADPEFARKARENRTDDIRLCLSCNQECVGRMGLNRWLGCIETPATGREQSLGAGTLQPVKTPKRVMVVGGGPAGLKAAIIAARRGHKVTLLEKEERLGGQIVWAVRVTTRAEFGDIVRNLLHEIEQLSVDVRTGVTATAESVLAERAGRGHRRHRLDPRPHGDPRRRQSAGRRCDRHPLRPGDSGQAGHADRPPRLPRSHQHGGVHGRAGLRGRGGDADSLRRPGPGRHPRSGKLVPAGAPARHQVHAEPLRPQHRERRGHRTAQLQRPDSSTSRRSIPSCWRCTVAPTASSTAR